MHDGTSIIMIFVINGTKLNLQHNKIHIFALIINCVMPSCVE